MSINGKTVVATTSNPGTGYTYHHVPGDGSCFINCYLDACHTKYRKEISLSVKSRIARKFRLDFANFLLTESKKSAEKISARLNIINPSVMCNIVKSNNDEKSSMQVLEEISKKYVETDEDAEEFIYGLILSYNFIDVESRQPFTYESIKTLYETDHRINVSRAENLSTDGMTIYDPSVYGYGKIPINIGYYELATNIGSSYEDIEECIKTLCHRSAFLTHLESSLIAKFISINAVIFPLGTYYKNHYKLIEHVEGAPEILMVNLGNIHWNLVSFTRENSEQLLLDTVPIGSKDAIFSNLTTLYSQRKL